MLYTEDPDERDNNSTFFDKIMGNKLSHANRIFEWNSSDISAKKLLPKDIDYLGIQDYLKFILNFIKFETSLDYFGGITFGNFPYYSPEVYRANVQDIKTTVAVNFTNNYKIEFGNFYRYEVEFNFAPAIAFL